MIDIMNITRRVTFRLYPNKTQEQKLHYFRKLHKHLYNACVYHRKTQYQKFGQSVDYFDQQNALPAFKECWYEYKELGSQTLQATVKRVDFAFQRFFKGLAKYPKFKSSRYYRGWTYPGKSGWSAHTTGDNGGLELKGIPGQIQMRGKAQTWGTPNTCTIVWKNNKWYASITVQCQPVRKTGTNAVGLDFGCLTAIAMSNGTKIDNPKFLANAQQNIRLAEKQKRRKRKPEKRKTKASRRWKKAEKKVKKLKHKVANQRQNWVHQVAAQITSDNSLVATEKLNVKAMTKKAKKRTARSEVSSELGRSKQGSKRKQQKTGLNRSILDVGFGMLREAIKYKVIEAGGVFVEVPTKKVKPSQTCPSCGHQKKKDLSERMHNCEKCNYQQDRDVAAAMVMLNYARGYNDSLFYKEPLYNDKLSAEGQQLKQKGFLIKNQEIFRGLERSSLDAEQPSSTYCGSMKQLGALKRQKSRVQRSNSR